jgi:hypothetical protein
VKIATRQHGINWLTVSSTGFAINAPGGRPSSDRSAALRQDVFGWRRINQYLLQPEERDGDLSRRALPQS